MKSFITGILSVFILSSCVYTELMHMSVLKAAPVTLPSYVKNVVIADRTQISKGSKIFDAVDKVVTLEGAKLDKEAAQIVTKVTYQLHCPSRRKRNYVVVDE